MTDSDDSSIRFIGSVTDEPGPRLRFMKRRRVNRVDRNGDPLDGLVNLWDLALVLAVGFLVLGLAGLGISGVLTADNMTIVTNPGTDQMQVIVKEGDQLKKLDLANGPQVSGVGTLLGSFYKLADGTVVYVASGSTPPEGSSVTPTTPTTPTPGATVTPTPGVTTYPTPAPYPTTAPQSGVTITPTPDASDSGMPHPK